MRRGFSYWIATRPRPLSAATTTAAVWCVFFVGHHFGELRDLVRHGLDLRCHCVGGCFRAVLDVGGLLFLGNRCLCNSGDVLSQFISGISFGCLIHAFEVVLVGGAVAVLSIDFVVFYEPFKIQRCFVKIILDCDALVFPLFTFVRDKLVSCLRQRW